jgi:hypothetical protein
MRSQFTILNLSANASQSLYGTLLGAFRGFVLVNIAVPIFTSAKFAAKIAANELLSLGG